MYYDKVVFTLSETVCSENQVKICTNYNKSDAYLQTEIWINSLNIFINQCHQGCKNTN